MFRYLAAILAVGIPVSAQLSREQRQSDFRALAETLARRYGPIEWKTNALKTDPLAVGPWLDRVGNASSDLQFFEIMGEYIASLKDSHSAYLLPSTFVATLPFSADIFEGKVLVDNIVRAQLPEGQFPFQIGDEVVAIDGRSAGDWINEFQKFSGHGTSTTQRRDVARWLTSRQQIIYPRAHEIGEQAAVVIRRQSGETSTFNIPWTKRGVAVTTLPGGAPQIRTSVAAYPPDEDPASLANQYWEELAKPAYRRDRFVGRGFSALVGFGSRVPAFALPETGFTRRQGAANTDLITSGTFEAGDLKIGYIRIPAFSLSRISDPVISEIRFFRENSDGLIIDVMRNPGGTVCVTEDIAANLHPDGFKVPLLELRIGWNDVLGLTDFVEFIRRIDPNDQDLPALESQFRIYNDAVRANRPRTTPFPMCGNTSTRAGVSDRVTGNPLSYSKPVVVLVDEFTVSAAETLAANLQDSGRAIVVGMRTAGAGGVLTGSSAPIGFYSDGRASLAAGIVHRARTVTAPDLPPGPHIENIGILPDVTLDFMTVANITERGKPFLDKLLEIAAEHIRKGK